MSSERLPAGRAARVPLDRSVAVLRTGYPYLLGLRREAGADTVQTSRTLRAGRPVGRTTIKAGGLLAEGTVTVRLAVHIVARCPQIRVDQAGDGPESRRLSA